jgi:hypothetical protein
MEIEEHVRDISSAAVRLWPPAPDPIDERHDHHEADAAGAQAVQRPRSALSDIARRRFQPLPYHLGQPYPATGDHVGRSPSLPSQHLDPQFDDLGTVDVLLLKLDCRNGL